MEHPGEIAVQCESCGARVFIEKGQFTVRCLFCDAPSVVSRPVGPNRPRPVLALGFAVEREAATRAVTQWIRRQKMAPFGLKSAAAERITGVYLPAYLYSATVESQYKASIAEKYESFGLKKNNDGGASLGTREETEYRDLGGRRVGYVADILVTASRNITNHELEVIEPFDLEKLRRYSAVLVAGWNAEEPSLTPEECLRLARDEVLGSIPGTLRRFMPGDGVSSLQHTTGFLEETLDPILAPVWVFAIRYAPGKPPLRILVNGQTGKVGGVVHFSWAKLAVIISAIAALLVALRVAASFL